MKGDFDIFLLWIIVNSKVNIIKNVIEDKFLNKNIDEVLDKVGNLCSLGIYLYGLDFFFNKKFKCKYFFKKKFMLIILVFDFNVYYGDNNNELY